MSNKLLLWLKRGIIVGLILGVLLAAVIAVTNYTVVSSANRYIEESSAQEQVDAIIILGARVYSDGDLSWILKDRMEVGIEQYLEGNGKKLLLSGDHGRENYDEVNNMKKFALSKGVPEEDIFMDHAGFNTYSTMYRAKEVFGVENAIIITQDYHLKRSVYIARQLEIEAYGVASDLHEYPKISKFVAREILARTKDFFQVNVTKPEPKFLGDKIDIHGDGRVTQD